MNPQRGDTIHRMSFGRYLRWLLAIPMIAAAVTLFAIRFEFGYWTRPPTLAPLFDDTRAITHFTALYATPFHATLAGVKDTVAMEYLAAKDCVTSGAQALPPPRFTDDDLRFGSPVGRLTREIVERGIVAPDVVAFDPDLARRVFALLRSHDIHSGRMQTDMHPEGPYAEFAEAVDSRGQRQVFFAAAEAATSNDHYPYVEARVRVENDGALAIEHVNEFEFESCGLEGQFHWMVGIGTALVLLAIWVIGAILLAASRLDEWLARRAAAQGPR